jgi:hypothetical protein
MMCPSGCEFFLEKRHGEQGGYFLCHQCRLLIPEDENGLPMKPVRSGALCGSPVFVKNQNGVAVEYCSNWKRHF